MPNFTTMIEKWVVKTILCWLLLFSGLQNVWSKQLNDEVRFFQTTYDFRDVIEANQILSHQYQFVVSGSDSIAIVDVVPSCGCIVPDWERQYLQPGDTGVINVGFNPYNRPGRFDKEVSVIFSNNYSEQLKISGDVLTEVSVRKKYPYISGNIRYDLRRFLYQSIEPSSEHVFKINLFNDSDNIVKIDSVLTVSNSLFSLKMDTWTIESGKSTMLEGVFKASEKLGYYEFGIQIFLDDAESELIAFDIAANVIDKSGVNSEDSKGAVLVFDNTVFDFGKVTKGTSVQKTIEISNEGSERLIVSNIKSNCSCLTIPTTNLKLNTGDSYLLKIILDTSNLDGFQQKALHFYSNADNGSIQHYMIKANVVE